MNKNPNNMFMNKSKESKNKIVKFLREIAVIVIGVAITLSASYLITKNSEKRDMQLYLNAIKMELEENLTFFDQQVVVYQYHVKYADYLKSNDKEALNPDSISLYQSVYYSYTPYAFNNDAFEMFKTSGNMRFLNDTELLLAIWGMYSGLSEIKKFLDMYMDMRLEDMKKEKDWSITERQKNIPMYNFYITEAPNNMLYVCEQGSKGINEILLMLDKALKIKKTPKNER
jgi:hypothetical protein